MEAFEITLDSGRRLHQALLKTQSCHDANLVILLPSDHCQQWQQSWHNKDSKLSMHCRTDSRQGLFWYLLFSIRAIFLDMIYCESIHSMPISLKLWPQGCVWNTTGYNFTSMKVHKPSCFSLSQWKMLLIKNKDITSMALRKTAVTPLLTHWSYCSLALSHQYYIWSGYHDDHNDNDR